MSTISTLPAPSPDYTQVKDPEQLDQREITVLFASVMIISVCAIVYELLISTLSSYLLGSSVLHFSLTIGLFMFFMGVGSFLSKQLHGSLLRSFICIETAIGLVGGASAFLLYLSYSLTELYYPAAFLLIASISMLAGLEIPVVTRIVQANGSLRETLAHVLSFDYVGALIASLLFPLILLPYLGIMKSAFLIGLLNVAIAAINIRIFRHRIPGWRSLAAGAALSAVLLISGFCYSESLIGFFERFIYQDQIIYNQQSAYQKIVVTKFQDDLRLFLDGNIQFSSLDEHRYHESLAHIPLGLLKYRERILILGGGDGLLLREVLKYSDVKEVVVVDLDPAMISLARTQKDIIDLNQRSFDDARVRIVNQDAFRYAETTAGQFNAILIDLPDPNNLSLGKLYTAEFYHILQRRLAAGGVLVTQSSSPYLARKAFWCVNETLQAVFESVLPYTVYVPSFGPWGFNLASAQRLTPTAITVSVPTKYLTPEVLPTLFVFDNDMAPVDVEVNRLDNQALVTYYEQSLDY